VTPAATFSPRAVLLYLSHAARPALAAPASSSPRAKAGRRLLPSPPPRAQPGRAPSRYSLPLPPPFPCVQAGRRPGPRSPHLLLLHFLPRADRNQAAAVRGGDFFLTSLQPSRNTRGASTAGTHPLLPWRSSSGRHTIFFTTVFNFVNGNSVEIYVSKFNFSLPEQIEQHSVSLAFSIHLDY